MKHKNLSALLCWEILTLTLGRLQSASVALRTQTITLIPNPGQQLHVWNEDLSLHKDRHDCICTEYKILNTFTRLSRDTRNTPFAHRGALTRDFVSYGAAESKINSGRSTTKALCKQLTNTFFWIKRHTSRILSTATMRPWSGGRVLNKTACSVKTLLSISPRFRRKSSLVSPMMTMCTYIIREIWVLGI